ncbi:MULTISPECIES: amino acid ABC transporter permease [Paraburkholderia]|uniref:Polar amino acid transport system permease protein n=1 Tax=Paraburkholderia tropica TaxID=92647 RepID=A0A1A5XET6_9BURK|nr:amino acid ABC transporter permease [Paraburkholderia tropica]MBB2982490.1 polar amino acid transport system permease protein [Paraburkholderia tropica]MBB3001644.1 polar amino acid transport system permease protein [Paraburkholderia tropica]MBB6321160.1 polar amino acid transport system permease protein [Paraburkholderia tropica]MDE1144887.1 amino acid ABC transporter permease [Paraburkholderia tropica]OBR51996.1 polar amino acid ABC transporter permease [Paraburkholderia tropica]
MSLSLLFDYLISADFVRGAAMTLAITVVSLLCGMLIGLVLALLQGSRNRVARTFTFLYLWLFRGTPVLFQIIFIYNVLPSFGIRFSAFVCAVLALSLNEGAFMSEIFRSGLHAVKQGQRTAGFALGMNGAKVFRHIVLPQALRVVLPPIGNQMIGMLKLSALVSVIAVQELLLVANQAASANFRYLEALSAAGIYYLAFTTLFMLLQGWMERALNRRRKSAVRRTSFAERLLGVSQPVVR